MCCKPLRLLAVMVITGISAAAVVAQQIPPANDLDSSGERRSRDGRRDRNRSRETDSNRDRDGWRDRDSGRDGGRGGWPGGRGGPPNSTPQQREEMYNRVLQYQFDRLTRTYELNNQQQQQVREHLEGVKNQQLATADQRRQQYESIRNEMHQLWENRRSGSDADRQRTRELFEQMRQMREQSPLFNPGRVLDDIEKLLPAEQAARGRAQWNNDEADRDRRRDEMRQRWTERRREEEAQRPAEGTGTSETPPQALEAQSDATTESERRSSRYDRYRRRDASPSEGQYGGLPPVPGGYQQTPSAEQIAPSYAPDRSGDFRGQRNGGLAEDPVGSWERYVRDFVRRYQLDASQQATAQSMLRAKLETRRAYEQSRRGDFQMAQGNPSEQARQQEITRLNKPVIELFEQLKGQLQTIPTQIQREAVDGPAKPPVSPTTSAPAAVTTTPASKPA